MIDQLFSFLSDNPQYISLILVGGLFFWVFKTTLNSLFDSLHKCLSDQANMDSLERKADREEARKNLELIVNTYTCIGLKVDHLSQDIRDLTKAIVLDRKGTNGPGS